MKKQFLILATTFITVAIISCNKENIETKEADKPVTTTETIAAKQGNSPSVNLSKGLEGWYRFDGNLKEATGKLADATTVPFAGVDVYTEDRNGVVNNAIKFNGRYRVKINNVPNTTKMSVAAWVKYDSANQTLCNFIISGSDGPMFIQAFDQFWTANNPSGMPWISSGTIDQHWHHLVATIDGTNLKFYVDGNLINTIVSPDTWIYPLNTYYVIGYGSVLDTNWHGAVDDLRFYSRTLTAAEVQSLYNL